MESLQKINEINATLRQGSSKYRLKLDGDIIWIVENTTLKVQNVKHKLTLEDLTHG